MKKIVSLIIAFLMVFSSSSVVFAGVDENLENTEINELENITINKSDVDFENSTIEPNAAYFEPKEIEYGPFSDSQGNRGTLTVHVFYRTNTANATPALDVCYIVANPANSRYRLSYTFNSFNSSTRILSVDIVWVDMDGHHDSFRDTLNIYVATNGNLSKR